MTPVYSIASAKVARRAGEQRQNQSNVHGLSSEHHGNSAPAGVVHTSFAGIVGESPLFLRAMELVSLATGCDVPTLIVGETGTGKELCARAIHEHGPRSQGPFVPVQCSAHPPDLLINELFGHERGAYTGADRRSGGIVASAQGGTLFLDEVHTLSQQVQVLLLRFLQDGQYRQMGSATLRKADVRIIAAYNGDIEDAIAAGSFREDLYQRLACLSIELPPLRDRRDDIPLLCVHFLREWLTEPGDETLSSEAMNKLLSHDWPGNVRELEFTLKRARILSRGGTIEPHHILYSRSSCQQPSTVVSLAQLMRETIHTVQRNYIAGLLTLTHGNNSRAAEMAGIERTSFLRLKKRLGI